MLRATTLVKKSSTNDLRSSTNRSVSIDSVDPFLGAPVMTATGNVNQHHESSSSVAASVSHPSPKYNKSGSNGFHRLKRTNSNANGTSRSKPMMSLAEQYPLLRPCIIVVFLILSAIVSYLASVAFNIFTENTGHDIFVRPIQLRSTNSRSIQNFRTAFLQRYGEENAKTILKYGVQRYGSINATAYRMLHSKAAQEAFVLAFGGYSVTVGRGNALNQSYPMVLKRILAPILKETLGLDVVVRNAAIGGIPSFPYGFCMEHFLGKDANVVSWDYSMNEQSGKISAAATAAVLESYVRHSQSQLPHHPLLIVLDTNRDRCKLLQDYTKQNLLQDALCVGMAEHALPNLQQLLQLPPNRLPPGLAQWDEFGAPPTCPGRSNWHPKKREHELIAWMIAAYFIDAATMAQQLQNENSLSMALDPFRLEKHIVTFPAPLSSKLHENPDAVTELMYGKPKRLNNGSYIYRLKPTSCRTNFLPATDAVKVLPSIVVHGLASGVTSDNIMEPRSDQMYSTGWVLDVSTVERETKVKVDKCGGLGYVDMKIALYGVPASGELKLWLPVENFHDEIGLNANTWMDEVIICEANEKRSDKACKLDRDIKFIVGGVDVEQPVPIRGAAEYLKRQTCVHLGIPEKAHVTRLRDFSYEERRRLSSNGALVDDHPGLIVQITAKKNVVREQGACCVSHVVWS